MGDQAHEKHQSGLMADQCTQIKVGKIRLLRDKVEGVEVGYQFQLC